MLNILKFPKLLQNNMKFETNTFGDSCTVKCTTNGKSIEAVVFSFTENKNLVVVLQKTLKLSLLWNGFIYTGSHGGLDFETTGPAKTVSYRGRTR